MLDLSIDGARLAQQRLSCLSQLHSPVRPAEKLHAQRIFECLDLARERGLRHMEANSSPVDISFLGNRNEISELTQIRHRNQCGCAMCSGAPCLSPTTCPSHIPEALLYLTTAGPPADTLLVSIRNLIGIGQLKHRMRNLLADRLRRMPPNVNVATHFGIRNANARLHLENRTQS